MIAKHARVLALHGLAALVAIANVQGAETARASEQEKRSALSDFKIIAERNIFNPKRYARSTNNTRRETPRATSRSETLVLTGTIAYEKGTYAFFDGSSSSFKKVLQDTGEVAGLTVRKIMPRAVLLATETNEFKLSVGHQLKRNSDGPWREGGQAEYVASNTRSEAPPPPQHQQSAQTSTPQEPQGPSDILNRIIETALGGGGGPPLPPQMPPPGDQPQAATAQNADVNQAPAPSAGGSPDEILRRLMERREQEMNQ